VESENADCICVQSRCGELSVYLFMFSSVLSVNIYLIYSSLNLTNVHFLLPHNPTKLILKKDCPEPWISLLTSHRVQINGSRAWFDGR